MLKIHKMQIDVDPLVNQWNIFKKTRDCNTAEIMQIAKLLISTFEEQEDEEDEQFCQEFYETFLSFLAEKKVDGEMLSAYDGNQFAAEIVAFSNNDEFERLSLWILEEMKDVNDNVYSVIKESLELKKVSALLHLLLSSGHTFIIIS